MAEKSTFVYNGVNMSDETPPAVKPGYKTTEFWLALAADIVAVLVASDVIESEKTMKLVALAGAVITRVTYTVLRFQAKRA